MPTERPQPKPCEGCGKPTYTKLCFPCFQQWRKERDTYAIRAGAIRSAPAGKCNYSGDYTALSLVIARSAKFVFGCPRCSGSALPLRYGHLDIRIGTPVWRFALYTSVPTVFNRYLALRPNAAQNPA